MSAPSVVELTRALSEVPDPLTGRSIMATNMVRDLNVEGNQVSFTIVLPALNVDGKLELNAACIQAVQKVMPEAEVNVHFMAESAKAAEGSPGATPQIKNIIAVGSGKGGVGKSTVSVNLAYGLKAMGFRVGLLDADLYGPSAPTMLGLVGQRPRTQALYDKPKIVPLQAHGMPVMSIGFIVEPEQAVVLRGPRLAAILGQFFQEVIWPELDYLVVDLPPGTGDIQLTLVQSVPVTGAIMVTTPQEVAVVDALKAMSMFRMPSVNVPIVGVVENMSWFTPRELPDNKYFLFGEGGGQRLADMGETTLLGQIPLIQGIRESGDSGLPALLSGDDLLSRPFIDVARRAVEAIDIRNRDVAPTEQVRLQQN
ncbi:MAG: P-loop NTPase [Saprospiraceae bacterium]